MKDWEADGPGVTDAHASPGRVSKPDCREVDKWLAARTRPDCGKNHTNRRIAATGAHSGASENQPGGSNSLTRDEGIQLAAAAGGEP